MASINIPTSFNSNLLSSINGVSVYSTDPYNPAGRNLNLFSLAMRSARKLSSAFYQSRTINIGVYIQLGSKGAAEAAWDSLVNLLQAQEAALVIPQSGTVRQYTATYSKANFNQVSGGFMDITLTFECSDSFGYDTNYTVMMPNNSSFSAASRADQYTQGGSADTQVPFFQVQYTALTGATNASVTIGNQNTGQAITVTRTFLVGDILQIDCRNKTVQVNGVDVAFTGAFPEFATGLQTYTYLDNMTTRTFKYFAYVYNRWA